MPLLISYLFTHPMALLPPVFLGVLSGVLWLYGLPLYALGYAAALCALPYVLVLAFGYARFSRRHRLLDKLRENALLCAEHLPPTRSAIEADYQALLLAVSQDHTRLAQDIESRYRERIGYYTMWAHQIKTPIAAMRLQLAGQESDSARELSCELTRIEQYVEMALCYLRLDADSTDYAFAPCALEPLVRAAAHRHAASFIRGHVQLILDPLPGDALTDEKWLSFVLDQLLTNAVKYTPPGGSVRIGLRGERTLFIEDTGIGIAGEDLPRIFEQGFTGLNGRTDKRASGIGLYLCSRICKNLGHTIRCESQPGRGTRMEIDLSSKALERE